MTDWIPSGTKDFVCSVWSQLALKQRKYPLGSPTPFYGFKGSIFCLYKSKFLCNVYLNHNRIPSEWDLKGLLYLFEIYSKYIPLILIFLWVLVKLVPLCNRCLHVMLCHIKLMELSLKHGSYLSTSILHFLGPEKQSNQNVKLNTSIKKYPTPPVSHKYHLWMPILERNGVCIYILCCNLHISDILFG